MKKIHADFKVQISGRRATLRPQESKILPSLRFDAGCALYRSAVRGAKATLIRAGYQVIAATNIADATPLQVLQGKAALPFVLQAPRIATRQRRVIVVCFDCDCTGDGGCKCKVVKCPERPVS